MLDFPSKDLIMDGEARDTVGDFFNVKNIVHMLNIALHNNSIHLSGRGYLPHHLTGADVLANSMNRELVNARFESEMFLPRNIPVVFEFLLRVVDEYVEDNKTEFNRDMRKKKIYMWPRDWAFENILPQLEELAMFERRFTKRARPMKDWFWTPLFKEVRGFPPYKEARNVFIAMRRFPSSQVLSQGLDYVHGKDALLHNVLVPRPTFPHLTKKKDSHPFKVFNHCVRIGEDVPQISGWFQKEEWGRMQEAGVVLLGFAELIYRCMYDAPSNTHEELAKLLSSIKFEKGDPWISFVDCSVPHLPKDIPRKYADEKQSNYGARIRSLLSGTVKACNAVIGSAGTAFRNSIPSFGFAFSPKKLGLKQNKRDLNVPLCKLEVIPPNALDFLWERIVEYLKERAGEGFVRDESFHIIESEVSRVFKMMNTVFKYTRDTHLRKRFEDSRKRTIKAIEKYTENLENIRNFDLRKLRRLARFPSTSRCNYIDGRYTRNDSFKQDAAALTLLLSQKSTPRQDVSEADSSQSWTI